MADTVDAVREEWDVAARGWHRHRTQLAAHTAPVRARMVELVDPRPGQTILELAAGLGELSRDLAGRVAPDGRVVCSDLSERMVAAARDVPDPDPVVDFRVLDAQQLPLDDAAMDAIVCKMGLMLFPDPAAAVREWRRVLRPGGRCVVATWGPLADNLWIATFGAAMLAHGEGPPGDPTQPGGIFSLSQPEALHALLTQAGFAHVDVEPLDVPSHADSFADHWQLRSETSGPLTARLQQLAPEHVEAIRATCQQYAAHLVQPDGSYAFPGRALVAVAH